MVFGTNTSFGISVGSDATSTPSLTVGYKRQEAVIMPLVANTVADGEKLNPCTQKTDGSLPESCVLLGKAPGPEGSDTYSVLASFGTKYNAGATNPNASGAIAQYFATGLAARELARNGGAATIATGDAAGKSARAEAREGRTERRTRETSARDAIAKKIVAAGDAGYRALLTKMDSQATGGSDFVSACPTGDTAVQCAGRLQDPGVLTTLSVGDFEDAAQVN
jgi:hypothetical protein